MHEQYRKSKHTACLFMLWMILSCFSNQVIAVEEINTDKNGVMIHGYDPVAYFLDNKPQLGWSAFRARYRNGTYYFSSLQNRDKFIANAERYAPAYGGYCSYGVRMGKKLDIDPHTWKIVDNTLYFQLNQGTHIVWNKDLNKNISIADQIWPKIRSKSVAKLVE